jgi:hypothetical protein
VAAGDVVFQVFQTYVFMCFIWMLRMLQWLYTHVSSVYLMLQAYVSSVFKRMFQVFNLDVT